MRTFDRLVEFDPKSRAYPVRALLATDQPRSYTWGLNRYLDQGAEGACVGFAWAHEAAARPKPHPVDESFARIVYRRAQHLDAWPGVAYEGTSVLAGAKAMKERGYLTEYRWAFSLDDLLVAVSRRGPAVIGVNWYTGMMDTDDRGFIRPTGGVEGGHAAVVLGVNVPGRWATIHNSWGPRWGARGRARIAWDDLGLILGQAGEACIPTLRP